MSQIKGLGEKGPNLTRLCDTKSLQMWNNVCVLSIRAVVLPDVHVSPWLFSSKIPPIH